MNAGSVPQQPPMTSMPAATRAGAKEAYWSAVRG